MTGLGLFIAILVGAVVAPAAVLVGLRWISDASRIHHAALKSDEQGPALALARSRPDLRRKRDKAAKAAAAQSEHATNCLLELFGSNNPDGWIWPLIGYGLGALLALVVTGFVTYFFNETTLQMTRLQVLAFGWGAPGILISTHLCLSARKLSKPEALLKLAQENEKLLKWGFFALFVAAVCFSVAKLVDSLPLWASPATLWLFEATSSWVSACTILLALVHLQAPFATFRSGGLSNQAELYSSAMRLLSERSGADQETLWPFDPQPSGPGPNGPSAATATPRPVPESSGGEAALNQVGRSRTDGDNLPYLHSILFAASLLAAGAASARAATVQISCYADTSASVFRGDVGEVLTLFHEQVVTYASESDNRTEIALCPWTGGPLASRQTKRFVIDSLNFSCRSIFKLACDHARAQARIQLDSLRVSQIARFERAMDRLTAAMAFVPVPSGGSCIGTLARDADSEAALGVSVVISDGKLEGCIQSIPRASHGSRCVFIVCASPADGDDAAGKASARAAALRELGYTAVDGPAGARSLDWPALFRLAANSRR